MRIPSATAFVLGVVAAIGSCCIKEVSPQNSAIEALVAQRNEGFQQFQPLSSEEDGTATPEIQVSQRPPAPTRPSFSSGKETATTLSLRWRGAWAPRVDSYPVVSFEVQYRQLGDPTWITAAQMGSTSSADAGAEALARYHHEIQTVSTRADYGETINNGWFRLSMHARGMNDADPESRTQTTRIPWNATASEFKAALDALDNLRFAGTTKHVTRSATPSPQGGFTWTVSFDVGKIGMHSTTSGTDETRFGDKHRNWPSLLVTETYFPTASWTGGGKHVAVTTARVGTGGSAQNINKGFNGDLHMGNAGLAACAHAGHVHTPSADGSGTHAGIEGPDYDSVKMAFPASFCELTITGLTQFTSYQARVRARNVHGWGPYSDISDPIGITKRGSPPLRPEAPRVTSRGAYSVTVASRIAQQRGVDYADGGEPILSWDFQIRLESGGGAMGSGAAQASAIYHENQQQSLAPRASNEHRKRTSDTRQGSRWLDIIPSASRGGMRRPLQSISSEGASITASGLMPMSKYVFRTRAKNALGSSPWSVASSPIQTDAGQPAVPSKPMVAERADAISDSSVKISWSYAYDHDVQGVDPVRHENGLELTSNGAKIARFEVERLRLTNRFYMEWEVCGVLSVGPGADGSGQNDIDGVRIVSRNEIQTISTRADPGNIISDGWFMLGFNHAGKTTADPESGAVTRRIPFDATTEQVKQALEELSNIGQGGILRVDRNTGLGASELFETGSANVVQQGGVGVGDAAGNAFRWTVVFDSSSSKESHLEGDLPLLTVVGEGISAPWTGGGMQVTVVESVKGGAHYSESEYYDGGKPYQRSDAQPKNGEAFSRNDGRVGAGYQASSGLARRTYPDGITSGESGVRGSDSTTLLRSSPDLSLTVNGLEPYTGYRFRVRAVAERRIYGSAGTAAGQSKKTVIMSDWSESSVPIRTRAKPRPWLAVSPRSTSKVILRAGSGRETSNMEDPSFAYGTGRGGMGLQPGSGIARPAMSGSNGLVVITSYLYGQTELPQTTFHYTGGEQVS